MLEFARMEFLVIMGIGTLVAIWIVANLPKPRARRRGIRQREIVSFEMKPFATPVWKKDVSEFYSTDDFDYLRKLNRYQNDPNHWPCPFPPQKHPEHSSV